MDEEIVKTGDHLSHLSMKTDDEGEKHALNDENKVTNFHGPNKEEQMKFNKLVMKAKQLLGEGKISHALAVNKKALTLCHSEKLAKKVAKMEAYLREHDEDSSSEEEEECDDGMVMVGSGFYLFKDLYSKLYTHQKQGVLWFWELFKKKKGGILGDDMGLGKTIQVIGFLSGMFDMNKVHSVLIAMPVSVMSVWEKEFNKWVPGIDVHSFHGTSKKEKERALCRVQRRGGVCLTSYGMVVTSWEQLGQQEGREFIWDYMILDEGHKIKNPTKTRKSVHAIAARHRIILTGTPIQNNLKELWALFDFVHQGTLLGTARTFKMEYENPITRAREKDSTPGEKRLGIEMAESLKTIMAPYFLRRTKAEVSSKQEDQKECSEDNVVELTKMPSFSRKNDLIVWVFLTGIQINIYQDFLSLDSVKELLMTKKSPLVALTVLKKICDHPRLLSTRACAQLGLDGEDCLNDSMLDRPEAHESAANKINDIADGVLLNESSKVMFLADLLDNLKSEGHRCLVFSQSRKILDIIEKVINNRGHKIMRLDGTVKHMCDRDKRIQKFQTDNSYSVFLLTTQVGGVGLTLTAADRVVIFDPSWNPATDAQAVDRVFRIGQNKNVVIYRLITCGTVEEKIYRRQVFKDSITRQTTGNTKNPYRYFTKQELRELFSLDNPHSSSTQLQLQGMHSDNRRSDTQLDEHIAFLHSLGIFGLSDHDLMFSEENDPAEEEMNEDEAEKQFGGIDYIQHRVQKAQELLKMESSLSSDIREQMNKYPRTMDVGGENRQRIHATTKQYQQPTSHKIQVPKFEPFEENIDLTSPSSTPQKPKFHEDYPENGTETMPVEVKSEPTSPMKQGGEHSYESEPGNMTIEITSDPSSPIKEVEDYEGTGIKRETSPIFTAICESSDEDKNIKKENASNFVAMEDSGFDNNEAILESRNIKVENSSFMPIHDSSSDDNEVYMSAKERSSDSEVNINDTAETSILEKSNTQGTPRKLIEDGKMILSPYVLHTPRRKPIILEEEMIISPDASRPLFAMQPKLRYQRNSSHSSNSSADSPASRFNLTLMSALSDSPAGSPKFSHITKSRLNATVVEDSPVSTSLNGRKNMTVVSESPERDTLNCSKIKNICVIDSVENSPAIEINKDVPQVKDSVENTPEIQNKKWDKSSNRTSSIQSKDSQSDSDEENSVIKGDNDMSYNDSPMHSVHQQTKHRAVILSSDEETELNSLSKSTADTRKDSVDGEHKVVVDNSDDEMISDTSSDKRELTNAGHSDSESDTDLSSFIVESAEESDGDEESDDEDEEDDVSDQESGGELPELPDDLKVMFESLVKKGRSLYKCDRFEEALSNILQALEINPDPSLQALALKLHQKINRQ